MTGRPEPPFALLDFRGAGPAGRRTRARPLLYARPAEILETRDPGRVPGLLRAVQRAAREGAHAVGYLAYEAAGAFDPALATRSPGPLPLAWFGIFGPPVRFPRPARGRPRRRPPRWAPDTTPEAHHAAVGWIREAIARGDFYQVNLTMRLRSRLRPDPVALFEELRRGGGRGYHALLHTGRHRLLSISPELFFESNGRRIRSRPMKGTRRRGRWEEEDDDARSALARSEKDRAENLMIVDLVRNDIGRVARYGSVRVPRLFRIERYPTVWQMTSTVEADLREGAGLPEIMAALFPCGSVTGAPKPAAMAAIARLEGAPRGVYCGAIGVAGPGDRLRFNVAIRTLWLDAAAGTAEYGAGGGITWDSEPRAEHQEALDKAVVLARRSRPFALLETLRLERGEPVRLERHLGRLASSARYFGFPERTAEARALLLDAAASTAPGPRSGDHAPPALRARLLAPRRGALRLELEAIPSRPSGAGPADASPAQPRPVHIAARRVRREDPFLQHKTTLRAAYRQALAERPASFDALLCNEEGEMTEFTRGNVVAEVGGDLLTPPRDCGLLPGTFRAQLLEEGAIEEAVLRPADIAAARRLWLINSVREWVPVALRGEEQARC